MTGIDDLPQVLEALRDLVHWKFLGLELGIPYSYMITLGRKYMRDIHCCKVEILAMWLEQDHTVIYKMGVPSWSFLKEALRNIGENELADTIREFDV